MKLGYFLQNKIYIYVDSNSLAFFAEIMLATEMLHNSTISTSSYQKISYKTRQLIRKINY